MSELRLFDLVGDNKVQVLLLVGVVKKVFNGMGRVVFQVVDVLPSESVNPIAV